VCQALKVIALVVPAIDQVVFCTNNDELQRLHLTAERKHTCTVMHESDTRYALSQLHAARRNAPLRTSFTVLLPLSTHADVWDPMIRAGKLVYTCWLACDFGQPGPSKTPLLEDGVYGVYHVPILVEPCDPNRAEEPFYCTFFLSTPSGSDVFVLFVCGATATYISPNAVERLNLPTKLLLDNAFQNIRTIDGSTISCSYVAYVEFVTQNLAFKGYAGAWELLPSDLDMVIGQDFMRLHETSLHFKADSFELQLYHPETSNRIAIERPYLPSTKKDKWDIEYISYRNANRVPRAQKLMIAQLKPTVAAAVAAFQESKQDLSKLPPEFKSLLSSLAIFLMRKVHPLELWIGVIKHPSPCMQDRNPSGNVCTA
jgi:hypothetical protein